MNTNADAREAVIAAIEANGTDVARRDQYDIDAIVEGVHAATDGYDIEAMGHDQFWALVERHDHANHQSATVPDRLCEACQEPFQDTDSGDGDARYHMSCREKFCCPRCGRNVGAEELERYEGACLMCSDVGVTRARQTRHPR